MQVRMHARPSSCRVSSASLPPFNTNTNTNTNADTNAKTNANTNTNNDTNTNTNTNTNEFHRHHSRNLICKYN